MDSPSATTRVISSETYDQETDCVEISKRVWQSNEIDEYTSQDYAPQDSYQGYETDEYRSELNSEEETVSTSSNYYSESSISKHEKYLNKKKKRVAIPLPVSYSQLRKQPPDPFRNCDLKAASGTRNAFDLMYTREKKNTRISEHDETNSVDINNKRVLYKRQKVNTQDESVGQSSDTSKSSKVSKFGGSLLRSPVWKWFEEIYVDNTRHGQCNVEMADKKPCDTKVKTGNSTTALWRHLKIEHGYSGKTEQQTTITKAFEASLSKPHSITEQAIRDRAIIEVVISQNLTFSFTEDKMFKRFAKIVDSRWTVPSRGKAVQSSIQAQHQLNREKNSTYNTWVRMLKLKPYIEILASSLTVQQEKDAIADGKRLKAIMITEDEWSAVANIIKILKPFNDITNYISGSSYPTMSIIYPTMSTLRNALLKEFEDEDINGDFTDEQIDINTSSTSLFDDEEELDEDAEQFKSPVVTTDLVESIKKIMAKLFLKYYKFSDDEILLIATAIDP
ncbi:25691_t:CDS:2, partial [Dentiscutata erythropus]